MRPLPQEILDLPWFKWPEKLLNYVQTEIHGVHKIQELQSENQGYYILVTYVQSSAVRSFSWICAKF